MPDGREDQALRVRCARIPGVRIDDEDAEESGYRVIFPEETEGLIRGLLKRRPRRTCLGFP